MSAAFSRLTPRRFTPAEYLSFERGAEFKSEYCDGLVYAMSGASFEHNVIAGNFLGVLKNRMRRGCAVLPSDQRVFVPGDAGHLGYFLYPDVTVVCGRPKFSSSSRDNLLNPSILVEVLSPSTARYDREFKLSVYKQASSVQAILIASQDRPRVEAHIRLAGGKWTSHTHSGLTVEIALPPFEISLPMAEIYFGVEFAATAKKRRQLRLPG